MAQRQRKPPRAASAALGQGDAQGTLAILAGGGPFPCYLAQSALAAGRRVHVIGFAGEADAGIANYPHDWVKMGEVGKLFAILKANDCRELVIIGGVSRPDLANVRLDLGAIKILPFLLSLTLGGDDTLLTRIVRYFEDKGYRVRAAGDIAPELLVGAGKLGAKTPNRDDLADIALGFEVVAALGRFDIGQAAVVVRNHVLAIEAVEGTDAMLTRTRELRQWGAHKRGERTGVLVKAPKPQQDKRVDLPAIGPGTVETAAAAGLAGIAVAAGQVLIADRASTIAAADKAGLFLFGQIMPLADDG
jgi:DUF1009 family protein